MFIRIFNANVMPSELCSSSLANHVREHAIFSFSARYVLACDRYELIVLNYAAIVIILGIRRCLLIVIARDGNNVNALSFSLSLSVFLAFVIRDLGSLCDFWTLGRVYQNA